MLKVFLASHAHLASGMATSLALFSTPSDRLRVYDAYVDGESRTLREELDEFFAGLAPEDEALLLSDLMGGSVNNVMTEYLRHPRTRLVTGINLAFLIEVMARGALGDAELAEIIDQSREGLREVRLDAVGAVPANDPADFF